LPRAVRTVPLALLAALVLAAPAGAATTFGVTGAPGPGPSRFDRVDVTRYGPSGASTVLVLVPGYVGGAGDFALVGPELARRVKGLQVWAVDRRSQQLEDASMFDRVRAGTATPKQALDYYVGWVVDPAVTQHFQPRDPARYGFMKRWGLQLALEDVRRVVLRARREGRRVILGGHSLGASMTAAYAAWDFAGRPGYRDVDGLVLVDGGLMGSFDAYGVSRARRALDKLEREGPWADLLGLRIPWAAGVLAEIGALAALKEPTAPSIGQAFPLLPPSLRPPFPVTNRALLGFAFDADTSPDFLALNRVRAGRLAATGDLRDWVDGEITPIERLARTFAASPNATEWYFPERLRIDVNAANRVERNAVTKLLGLRLYHRRAVDRPLYALQTALTKGGVLRGARRYVDGSRIPAVTLVDAAREQDHLDPLTAAPGRNRFVTTVVPFLRRIVR